MRNLGFAEFRHIFGRMIKGVHSFLLEGDQLSDTRNMQPGFHWKQRKGMSALTAAAVDSGLRFKSGIQFTTLRKDTDTLVAHTFDSSNGERVLRGSALPPNAITWSELFDLTTGAEIMQFAQVGNALIGADNEEFIIWRGDSHIPTGVWKFLDSTSKNINFFDETTDGLTASSMSLNSLGVDDRVLILSEMPLNKINITLGNTNSAAAELTVKKYNGALVDVSATDGTETSGTNLDDTFPGPSFDAKWTETDTDGMLAASTGAILTPSAGNDGSTAFLSSDPIVRISGNFDIHLQFSNISWLQPVAGTNNIRMVARQDASNEAVVGRRYQTSGNNQYTGRTLLGGVQGTEHTAATTDTSGWLRITRTNGDDISYYEGSPGSWTQIGSTDTNQFSGIVSVEIQFFTGDVSEWTSAQVDQIDLNSGTIVNVSLSQDGAITWTLATDEITQLVEGIPGYQYELSWSGVLDSSVSITDITVHSPMGVVKNIWSGINIPVTGCKFFDASADVYEDYTAFVNNDIEDQHLPLDSMTTSDKIYVGFAEPARRIMFSVKPDEPNTVVAGMASLKYFDTDGNFTSVGTFTETTSDSAGAVFAQSGYADWDPLDEFVEKPTTLGGDTVPWFWYEIMTDTATLDDPVSVFKIEGIPNTFDPDRCRGAFAFKRRAWQLAPYNNENAVRYSSANLPNVFNGLDSGWIFFGERPLLAAAPFYNETVIYCDREMWILQGSTPASFGRLRLSANIGIAAPNSLVSIEAGVLVGTNIKIVLAWIYHDGIWMFDGIKWWKISSPDIDNFFDPTHDEYINPSFLDQSYGGYDYGTQCAYWVVYSGINQTTPNRVIVLHVPTMWYGIYEYATDLSSLFSVINERFYFVAGGNSDGKFYQLDVGNQDLNASGTATAIDAFVITRDLFSSYSDEVKQRLFSLVGEAQSGGMIELDEYPDGSKTPVSTGKGKMTSLGKTIKTWQWPLKQHTNQKSSKFRIRNRSLNKAMQLFGYNSSMDVDKEDE